MPEITEYLFRFTVVCLILMFLLLEALVLVRLSFKPLVSRLY